jgi:hypothetical protein
LADFALTGRFLAFAMGFTSSLSGTGPTTAPV